MYFFCQLCNYPLLTERAEPWKLVADTRVTGSKDLVASSSASGGNKFECYLTCNEHILICKSAGYRTLRYSLTRLVVAGQLDGKRSSKLSFILTKLVAPLGEGGAAN